MRQNERGFTLIEILIALFLISIVTAAIYKTFRAQQ
ncbi:MAG: prepilin-type cleavage/methylation domain-containing protein, partial [Deltaproteobacteria bacterium]